MFLDLAILLWHCVTWYFTSSEASPCAGHYTVCKEGRTAHAVTGTSIHLTLITVYSIVWISWKLFIWSKNLLIMYSSCKIGPINIKLTQCFKGYLGFLRMIFSSSVSTKTNSFRQSRCTTIFLYSDHKMNFNGCYQPELPWFSLF